MLEKRKAEQRGLFRSCMSTECGFQDYIFITDNTGSSDLGFLLNIPMWISSCHSTYRMPQIKLITGSFCNISFFNGMTHSRTPRWNPQVLFSDPLFPLTLIMLYVTNSYCSSHWNALFYWSPLLLSQPRSSSPQFALTHLFYLNIYIQIHSENQFNLSITP